MSQAWTIVSGKGGVGKSMIASALGLALANRRLECCLVDADMGLRSLDMLLNMQNKVVFDALDVANRDCKLRYALVRHAAHETLSLLPAAQLGDLRTLDVQEWERIVRKAKKRAAYVIVDAPAGIGRGVRNLLAATDHCILVATPDDVSLRDAEQVTALLDSLGKPRPMLIVNRVIPEWVKAGDMYAPQTVAATLDVPLLGFVPEDRAILRALSRHESFMEADGPAHEAMERIASRFLGEYIPMPALVRRRPFWRRLGKPPVSAS